MKKNLITALLAFFGFSFFSSYGAKSSLVDHPKPDMLTTKQIINILCTQYDTKHYILDTYNRVNPGDFKAPGFCIILLLYLVYQTAVTRYLLEL